jgi:hypothetical protein
MRWPAWITDGISQPLESRRPSASRDEFRDSEIGRGRLLRENSSPKNKQKALSRSPGLDTKRTVMLSETLLGICVESLQLRQLVPVFSLSASVCFAPTLNGFVSTRVRICNSFAVRSVNMVGAVRIVKLSRRNAVSTSAAATWLDTKAGLF